MSNMLEQKLEQAKLVINDALAGFDADKSVVAWSGGKDSTLLLKLVLEVCRQQGYIPPRVMDIDQRDQFNEITEFRDELINSWNLQLLLIKNDDFLSKVNTIGDRVPVEALNDENQEALQAIHFTGTALEWSPDSPACNHLLKTVPINRSIADNQFEAMFTGIRWDEHPSRVNETFFSDRDNPQHTRIHPLLHFTERDIWDATFALEVPYCSLYQWGYRSLGTKHGTRKSSDIPAWEQDLENTDERGHRQAEKEKVMEQLRAWGYL